MSKRIDRASRSISASASTIYQAFATPDALEAWLPPKGMIGEMLEFDFREGGYYRIVLSYNGPDHTPGKTSEHSDEVEVRLVELVPDKRIEQAVVFDSESPEFAGEMVIIRTFEEEEGGTRVRVRCENVPEGIRPQDHEAGLNSSLENLAEFTEGGRNVDDSQTLDSPQRDA